jgi:NADPH-dependent 2,4-dienoyl-CoA reductase/sulfur reductase-like enzyme/peroxiredoxin family protein/rhodanese-related sulfurtransferase/TusA-related sulfurtransferase
MSNKKKILIVGGVAGGASTATRARRLSEEAEIIIFERGEYISFANCGLPYHISGEIIGRDNLLLQTPERMKERYNIDVRVNSEVIAIDRNNKTILIKETKTGRQYSEVYDSLVLSPGAKPIRPHLPGIDTPGIFTLRNIMDMDQINHWLQERSVKNAVVIGGGYIGLEVTEALHKRGIKVAIVELANQVMASIDPEMANLLHQELTAHNIDLHLGVAATEFHQQHNQLLVKLSSHEQLTTDMVILAIGVKPEITLAQNAGLEIGKLGGIVVNEQLRTSDENIYALGDVIEVINFITKTPSLIPLAGPANRQGRIIADTILGRQSSYQNTQGTGVCKVFDLTVAMTGVTEKVLQAGKYNYEKIYVHAMDHASYYPNATPITLKLLFDKKSGALYGTQAIGAKGVDKRIDVLATAMRANLSVFDLQNEELAYAPPFGSAKDIINHAAFVAGNVINGDVQICHAVDVLALTDQQLLLDVRTYDEMICGTIHNAQHIPIDELRERLNELPKDKEIITFCKVGLRGYLACRILMQHGFKCRNLSGGFTTYQMATNTLSSREIAQSPVCRVEKDEIENMQVTNHKEKIVKYIDARGLQCPGPIQKLKMAIDEINDGEAVLIFTTDRGFLADAPAWCKATGNMLISSIPEDNGYQTIVRKGTVVSNQVLDNSTKRLTIIVFSNDLDKALAAFIIANGAAAMGYEATLFFTFWGLNVLRKDNPPKVKKTLIEKMFGMMMPRGAKKLVLSKMNMCGIGTAMIKDIMRKKNVSSLPELIASAKEAKVRLIACNMAMDLMGIKQEELIDGVEVGGVATFLQNAGEGGISLFI